MRCLFVFHFSFMNILKAFFITIYFNTTFHAVGQQSLFDHPQAMELVGKGTECIYKLKVDSAMFYIRELQKLLPNHPVIPSMEAFLIRWENIPIRPNAKSGCFFTARPPWLNNVGASIVSVMVAVSPIGV